MESSFLLTEAARGLTKQAICQVEISQAWFPIRQTLQKRLSQITLKVFIKETHQQAIGQILQPI